MKKKTAAIYITLLALIIFTFILYRAAFYAPNDEIPMPAESTEGRSLAASEVSKDLDSYPYVLSIPEIGVKAKIVEVGITAKGNMASPRGFRDVGWYKYGTVPGEIGSAVIAGHVDNGLALPAVFSNLKDLKKGDDIYIKTGGDKNLHFIVTGSEVYDFNERVPEIFKEDDEKILRLITCTGSWIKEYRTHDKRLVVSSILVE